MSAFKRVSPSAAARMLTHGAVLVDVREPDERLRSRIPGAVHLPLSDFTAEAPGEILLFHCRSGARTAAAADRLAQKAGGRDWYVIEGGLEAWRRARLPVLADRGRPIELQRQVQITAGALTAAGVLLGVLITPWFLAVPLFVGGGLAFAGLTGTCGMARLLTLAPWNRRARAHTTGAA